MENNKYLKPIIEVIKINKEDIITTSGAVSVAEALFGKGKEGVLLE